MQIIHHSCCGIDVHARTVVVCLIKSGRRQIRTYSAMTDDLLTMCDWLVSEGCTQAAIESTGIYWKPVYNILEGFLEVNARHVKAVPGRGGRRARLRVAGRSVATWFASGEFYSSGAGTAS